jgi:hypothetical protein
MNRKEDETGLIRKTKLSPDAERIRFLYIEYEPKVSSASFPLCRLSFPCYRSLTSPQYWYWELVETGRRLSLTAILSVIAHGTPQQSVLSVLMSITFVKLYAFYAPYLEDTDDVLAEVGQYQILFTFFGALMIQANIMKADETNTLGLCLICVNVMIVFVPVWVIYKEYQAEVKRKEEEEEDWKEEDEGNQIIGRKGSHRGSDDGDGEWMKVESDEKDLAQPCDPPSPFPLDHPSDSHELLENQSKEDECRGLESSHIQSSSAPTDSGGMVPVRLAPLQRVGRAPFLNNQTKIHPPPPVIDSSSRASTLD